MFPKAVVFSIEVTSSDHLPIFLNLNLSPHIVRRRRFRFENVWVSNQDCVDLILDYWERHQGSKIHNKLAACGVALSQWSGDSLKFLGSRINSLRHSLKRLRGRRDP